MEPCVLVACRDLKSVVSASGSFAMLSCGPHLASLQAWMRLLKFRSALLHCRVLFNLFATLRCSPSCEPPTRERLSSGLHAVREGLTVGAILCRVPL